MIDLGQQKLIKIYDRIDTANFPQFWKLLEMMNIIYIIQL